MKTLSFGNTWDDPNMGKTDCMLILKLLRDSLKIVMLVLSQVVRTYGEECYGTQFSLEISRYTTHACGPGLIEVMCC